MKTLFKVVIIAIVAGGAFMLFGDDIDTSSFTKNDVATQKSDSFGSTTSLDATQVFGKTYTLTTIGTDKSDPAISYGGDTEYTTICYKDNNSADTKDWTPIATSTSANPEVLSVPVQAGTKAQGGLVEMWCDVNVGTSQDYYVDKDRLIQDNSRISKVIFDKAPSTASVSSWIYNYNLIDISVANPNQLPTDTVYYILVDEGSLTVSDPASLASVGTGSATNVLKYKLTMDNAGDGEAISRVQVTMNGTEDDRWKINESFFEIDGIGKIFLNDPKVTESCTTNCVYKYDISATVDGAPMIFIPESGDTELNAHVTIESALDSTDEAICVELAVRTVDAQGAYTTASADAEIAEGTNTDECTL